MKLEKGYHFLVIFLWPSTVCKYGTGKTGRTSSLGLNCGTGNGWNRLWNRGAPSRGEIKRNMGGGSHGGESAAEEQEEERSLGCIFSNGFNGKALHSIS